MAPKTQTARVRSLLARASLETLENRCLLTTAYGDALVRIGLDQARVHFPTILGTGEAVVDIDSGVLWNNSTHQPLFGALAGKIWSNTAELNGAAGVDDDQDGVVDDFYGWNFVEENGNLDHVRYSQADLNANPLKKFTLNAPIFPHGTATAVFMVSQAHTWAQDGKTYEGIATGAKVIPLRYDLDQNAYGFSQTNAWLQGSTPNVEQALKWVLDASATHSDIAAVNMSIGTWGYDYIATVVKNLVDANTVVLAGAAGTVAASNTRYSDVSTPAKYPGVLAVGGTTMTKDNKEAVDVARTVFGPRVDLVAPGAPLPVGYPYDAVGAITNNTYVTNIHDTATSWATAMVTATAALIKQLRPDLSASTIRDIMIRSADKVRLIVTNDGNTQSIGVSDVRSAYNDSSGYYIPRLNVDKALTMAFNEPQPPTTAHLMVVGVDAPAIDTANPDDFWRGSAPGTPRPQTSRKASPSCVMGRAYPWALPQKAMSHISR